MVHCVYKSDMHKIWNLYYKFAFCNFTMSRSKQWRHWCNGGDTDKWHKRATFHNKKKRLLLSQQIMFMIPYSLNKY